MLLVEPEADLQTERLQLEPLQRHHAPCFFGPLQDPLIYRYVPQDPPASLEWLERRYELLQRRLSPAGDEAWLNWAVRLRDDQTYIGRVEATVVDDGTAFLAYELFTDFWGKGYASEACRCVIDLLFRDYRLREIVAEVDTRNNASIRLLERLGFERSELRIGADDFKGARSDELVYRLARPFDGLVPDGFPDGQADQPE